MRGEAWIVLRIHEPWLSTETSS